MLVTLYTPPFTYGPVRQLGECHEGEKALKLVGWLDTTLQLALLS